MGHDHAHGESAWAVSSSGRRLVSGGLVVVVVATLVGLIVLWPRGSADVDTSFLGQGDVRDGTVERVERRPCSYGGGDPSFQCDVSTIRVTSGAQEGDQVALELQPGPGVVRLASGDRVVLYYDGDLPPGRQYQFADYQRRTPLLWLAVLFVVVVLALGRFRGLMALVGLAVSVLVLVVFVLPSLLRGHDPVAVALVGSAAIAFAALYLAHGFNERTTVALLGTFASLLLTGILAVAFVGASNFTGLASEEAGILQLTAGQVDVKGLLLAGIVIGSLGVLDDVTVTQVSAVAQLHAADPRMGAPQLYRRAVTIGRDHIASTVNTLVLAYAGASLPLLLLFTETSRPFGQVVNGETVAVEIVRTLVGSVGLVASVPITTALAVAVIAGRTRKRAPSVAEEADRLVTIEEEPTGRPPGQTPSWDDFAPPDKPTF